MNDAAPQSRIRRRNVARILEAALEVFSSYGFRGATLDQIAAAAGLSKPNILYYFRSKEEMHARLLEDLLDHWLAPLRELDPQGDPVGELLIYARRKLQMSRDYPRESRLFANEILSGAPRIEGFLRSDLRAQVARTARVLESWAAQGRIARVDPHHLLFAIWAQTQHYADFATQIAMVMEEGGDPFPGAEAFLEHWLRRALTPP